VSVEQAMNSQGVETNGTHHVSPTEDKRVRLAVVESEFASVTISLDTAGHGPRLHVRDNETGDDILLSAIELASLCLATSEDRAGWLRVGLYRTDVAAGPHGSGVDAGGHQGAAE
jgi:hypothetical protein